MRAKGYADIQDYLKRRKVSDIDFITISDDPERSIEEEPSAVDNSCVNDVGGATSEQPWVQEDYEEWFAGVSGAISAQGRLGDKAACKDAEHALGAGGTITALSDSGSAWSNMQHRVVQEEEEEEEEDNGDNDQRGRATISATTVVAHEEEESENEGQVLCTQKYVTFMVSSQTIMSLQQDLDLSGGQNNDGFQTVPTTANTPDADTIDVNTLLQDINSRTHNADDDQTVPGDTLLKPYEPDLSKRPPR